MANIPYPKYRVSPEIPMEIPHFMVIHSDLLMDDLIPYSYESWVEKKTHLGDDPC